MCHLWSDPTVGHSTDQGRKKGPYVGQLMCSDPDSTLFRPCSKIFGLVSANYTSQTLPALAGLTRMQSFPPRKRDSRCQATSAASSPRRLAQPLARPLRKGCPVSRKRPPRPRKRRPRPPRTYTDVSCAASGHARGSRAIYFLYLPPTPARCFDTEIVQRPVRAIPVSLGSAAGSPP